MNTDEEIKIEGNIDINQALKDFEAKSDMEAAKTVPKVSGGAETAGLPTMVRWVMKLSGGAIKEQKSAEYVLLVLVVVVIGISLFIFFDLGDKLGGTPPLEFEQLPY